MYVLRALRACPPCFSVYIPGNSGKAASATCISRCLLLCGSDSGIDLLIPHAMPFWFFSCLVPSTMTCLLAAGRVPSSLSQTIFRRVCIFGTRDSCMKQTLPVNLVVYSVILIGENIPTLPFFLGWDLPLISSPCMHFFQKGHFCVSLILT